MLTRTQATYTSSFHHEMVATHTHTIKTGNN